MNNMPGSPLWHSEIEKRVSRLEAIFANPESRTRPVSYIFKCTLVGPDDNLIVRWTGNDPPMYLNSVPNTNANYAFDLHIYIPGRNADKRYEVPPGPLRDEIIPLITNYMSTVDYK